MIFLEGQSGSGKTTAGRALARHGFLHVSFRELIAPVFGGVSDRDHLYEAALASARVHGPEALYPEIRRLLECRRASSSDEVVIDGTRSSRLVAYLRRHAARSLWNPVVFLDTGDREIAERLARRGVTDAVRARIADFEIVLGIDELREDADVTIRVSTLHALEREVACLVRAYRTRNGAPPSLARREGS